MAQYLIEDTTLAGLADSARVITGETKELSPAEMKEQLMIAEQQIGVQANLIEQISNILDDKGSGGNTQPIEYKTCTMTIINQSTANTNCLSYYTLDETGKLKPSYIMNSNSLIQTSHNNVVCEMPISLYMDNSANTTLDYSTIQNITSIYSMGAYHLFTIKSNDNITIIIIDNSSGDSEK